MSDRRISAGAGTSRVGGRRDAEHAAAVRSRKARAAIRRGDFVLCDPRRSQRRARRISAPDICRPHASVVAAGTAAYEPRAISRCAEPRRTPSPLARCMVMDLLSSGSRKGRTPEDTIEQMLTDDELVGGFEAATLDSFAHADHVRLTIVYLSRHGREETERRLLDGLRRFAVAKNVPQKFHVTMTRAWIDLID